MSRQGSALPGHEHTEELITFLLDRAEADDLLASGLPRWATLGRLTGPQLRALVADYREAVHRVSHSREQWDRWVWLVIARYHAFLLRFESRPHKGREGFNRAWLRAR